MIRNNSWGELNLSSETPIRNTINKNLVIYSYSISNNFIREALSKSNLKFTLTNDLKKASLIIGLKKHLRQNFRIKQLAKQKNIPIYSLTQLSLYQFIKLIKKLV